MRHLLILLLSAILCFSGLSAAQAGKRLPGQYVKQAAGQNDQKGKRQSSKAKERRTQLKRAATKKRKAAIVKGADRNPSKPRQRKEARSEAPKKKWEQAQAGKQRDRYDDFIDADRDGIDDRAAQKAKAEKDKPDDQAAEKVKAEKEKPDDQ